MKRAVIGRVAWLLTRIHIALYRASGGRILGTIWGLGILLLTTTGRKTGKQRTTPLCYFVDGDSFVVVASSGGSAWYPAWWHNLMGTPQAVVETGPRRIAVRGREASPEERERLWAAITGIAPGYLKYQARTKRTIPLGILEPV